jgi:RNA polymerase sigma-70 factor, ECF subfamily
VNPVLADRAAAMAEEESSVIARCLRGDRAAERELFRRERGRVHATLYRVLGSNRDVDDLIQDTFLEVFRSLASFRGEAKLATWIDRIAVRVAYRYLAQKKGATMSLLTGDEGGDEPDADRRAQAREGLRRLYDALAALSPRARLAFALHAIDGRPLAEVARLTGAALVATKLRVWRARRELRARAAVDPVLAEFLGAEEAGS